MDEPVTMEAIQKIFKTMVEDSEKRLEDLIIKMTSSSSGAAKGDDLDDDDLDKDKVDEDELGEMGFLKPNPLVRKNPEEMKTPEHLVPHLHPVKTNLTTHITMLQMFNIHMLTILVLLL